MRPLVNSVVSLFRGRPLVGVGAGVLLLVVIVLLARTISPAHKPAQAQAPQVTAEKARRMDLPVYRLGIGTVRALNSVVLKTRVDGALDKIMFEEGQDVKAGDVLAQLDPRPFQATLNQALAKKAQDDALLVKARADLTRSEALSKSQFSSRQSLEAQQATTAQLQATVKADEAQIEAARLQLLYSTITAPISGRIGLRQVDTGNILRTTDANGLAVISQIHPISVTFSLPAAELPRITKAMARGKPRVSAYSSDDSQKLADGELLTIDSTVDSTTGTIRSKAVFQNSDNSLWPGQSVSAHLLLDTVHDAVIIPTKAIQRGPKGLFVYAVQQNKTVAVQPIEVGESFEELTVVSAGVTEGDLVVTDGHSRLQPGTHVTVADKIAEGDAAAARANR